MAIPEIVDLSEVIQNLVLGSTITDADRALLTTIKIRIEAEVRRFVGHNIVQPTTPYVEFLPGRPGNIESVEMYEVQGNQLVSHISTQYGDVLQLSQMWLRSITSIYEDRGAYGGQKAGDFAAGTLLTLGTHYWVNYDRDAADPELNGTQSLAAAGQVIRVGASWSRVPRTIKVTYVAGLTAAELDGAWSDIKSVVIHETLVRFKVKKALAGADADYLIKSEKIGGEYAVTYEDRDTLSNDLSDKSKEKLERFMVMAL
jgi:DNA-binding transcriptional ArsR family regulator